MKGTTSSGFEFETNENVLTDWRFTKTVTAIEKGDDVSKMCATVDLINMLLGDTGEAALCEHVKEADGIVPSSKVMKEAGEIISIMRDKLKNS
jgi:hypothetical protein